MARQTAAQKLAARAAAATTPDAAEGEPPADPPAAPAKTAPAKTAPVEAPYTLFGLYNASPPELPERSVWLPLGEVKAPTYQHAMEMAKDGMRDWVLAQATEETPVPATLRITVAAIASRNWNQGTAIIESRPVTTWEK